MDRLKWTILVNSLLFLAFVVVLISGVVLWLNLAAISGLSRGAWSGMHINSSIVFTVLVGAHLWLHRTWIINMPRMLKRSPPKPQDNK